MIKKIFKEINCIDNKILKAIKIGNVVSFTICLVSIIILLVYSFNPISYNTYKIGSLLFRTGLFLLVDTIISGFICDKLRKQII